MRVLVIGGSGLVGSHILSEAKTLGNSCWGTFRKFHLPGLISLGLENEKDCEDLICRLKPDWVIHAAGWSHVDGCENDPQKAFLENAEQPAFLAKLCRIHGIRFAYCSTTYVFDGKKGEYSELDTPNPLNIYSHSKLKGEQLVQSELKGQGLVIRLLWVWGKEPQRKNFVYQTLAHLQDRKTILLPSDQWGNPTWAGDIAYWTLGLMVKNMAGVFHLVSDVKCNKVEWHDKLCRTQGGLEKPGEFEYRQTLATSKMKQKALRPLDASASNKTIQIMFPRATRDHGSISDVL